MSGDSQPQDGLEIILDKVLELINSNESTGQAFRKFLTEEDKALEKAKEKIRTACNKIYSNYPREKSIRVPDTYNEMFYRGGWNFQTVFYEFFKDTEVLEALKIDPNDTKEDKFKKFAPVVREIDAQATLEEKNPEFARFSEKLSYIHKIIGQSSEKIKGVEELKQAKEKILENAESFKDKFKPFDIKSHLENLLATKEYKDLTEKLVKHALKDTEKNDEGVVNEKNRVQSLSNFLKDEMQIDPKENSVIHKAIQVMLQEDYNKLYEACKKENHKTINRKKTEKIGRGVLSAISTSLYYMAYPITSTLGLITSIPMALMKEGLKIAHREGGAYMIQIAELALMEKSLKIEDRGDSAKKIVGGGMILASMLIIAVMLPISIAEGLAWCLKYGAKQGMVSTKYNNPEISKVARSLKHTMKDIHIEEARKVTASSTPKDGSKANNQKRTGRPASV